MDVYQVILFECDSWRCTDRIVVTGGDHALWMCDQFTYALT